MTKAEARNWGRAARARLAPEEQAELDRLIVARCQAELDWGQVRRVHVFLPLRSQREINTWPLVEWLWQAHPEVEVVVPRLAAVGMEAAVAEARSQWRENRLGIPEPVDGRVMPAGGTVDVALVPLLAFDDRGHRVGYGGGYYDWFLATQRGARKVGLAYEASRVAGGIAAEEHDVRLEAVVTERWLWGFRK
jgi:5-formyltetrahydrofolate cyclo-ligase